jgi:hypothetical protein
MQPQRTPVETICPARRDFLRAGSLSLLGMGLSQYFGLAEAQTAAPGKAQACILLLLEGGPSHMDTWDPKPLSGFKPISTNVPGIQISELFPRIARRMDQLSIIRSLHTEERNHPQGAVEFLTGHRPTPIMKFPSIGSIIAKEVGTRNEVPPFIAVPEPWEFDFFDYEEAFQGAFIGSEYNALVIPDPSKPDFQVPDLSLPKTLSMEAIEDRKSLLNVVDQHYRETERLAEFGKMDKYREQALKMILSPAVRNAFDFSQESDKTKDAYGRHRFGQSVLMARRLVESGARFVTAAGYKHGQWDTHGMNDKNLRDDLAPPLDQALSALLDDLKQRGLYDSTVVIAMGEFGRTPYVNPNGGRDHWPDCWSVLLGGGGIRGGGVVGSSDEKGAYVKDDMMSIGDLYATIYKAFGIDWTKTYMSPIGRPVYIANARGDVAGTPIKALV